MSRLLISAAHKSSGKTTVSVGLCAALSTQGLAVQAFKKGPDYIDPMWLSQASGRACFNLDPYLMTSAQITDCFVRHGAGADLCLVEGNKGLYDGLALDGSNSNAALAQMLDLPVVLVLDARGMTRGIAPLILGYQAFDPHIRIVGVILNQLGGARHEAKLRAMIEHYTDVTVLGALGHDPRLSVVERHLGLMPSHEHDAAAEQVRTIGHLMAEQVDLSRVVQAAGGAAPLAAPLTPSVSMPPPVTQTQPPPTAAPAATTPRTAAAPRATPPPLHTPLRIGVARDKAFGFYYPDDLLALQQAGAEIIPINTLQDRGLPALDGLLIGGGFPEMFMAELQANSAMRASIRTAIAAGLPTYAECGGLMYLARTLRWKDQVFDMVGAIPADARMHERPVGRGYVALQPTGLAPWSAGAPVSAPTCATDDAQGALRGHEFHYSSLENTPPDLVYAYRVTRGHGVDGQHDGIVLNHLLASYTHLRNAAGSQWVAGFMAFVHQHKLTQQDLAGVRLLQVNGSLVATDTEGYLKNTDEWTEDFARAQAEAENLQLTEAHWQVITFLRAYFEEHRVQAQVRAMIWHFAKEWGPEYGNNHHLHTMFPVGGPQKQGNRLAGLLKTKGEH